MMFPSGMGFLWRIHPQTVLLAVVEIPMKEQGAHDFLVGITQDTSMAPDLLELIAAEHHLDVFPYDRVVQKVRPIIRVGLELGIGPDRCIGEVFWRPLGF